MKWLGQHIIDIIARFRSDVYLDGPSAGDVNPGKFLALDSTKKIVYRTSDELKSDIGAGAVNFDGSTANGVLTYKDVDEATVESNLTFDGSTLTLTGDLAVTGDNITFESPNADDPAVIIRNTTNDNQAARLQMRKNRTDAQADNDRVAELDFMGEDASGTLQQYGKVMVQAVETDHNSETGKVRFQVAEYNGTLTDGLVLTGQDADGEIDVTIGAGVASDTTVSGNLKVNGTTTTFESATADSPQVTIKNTTDDDQASQLIFDKLRADDAVATGQNLGEIHFKGQDNPQNSQTYSYIISEIDVSTGGQESGKLNLGVASHNGTSQPGLILTGGSVAGEVDATIGRGADSVTTVSGDLEIVGTISSLGTRINASFIGGGTIGDTEYGRLNGVTGNIQTQLDDKPDRNGTTTTDGMTLTSANASAPTLTLQNTHSGATGGILEFKKDKGAAGADNDDIGTITFVGDDAAQTQTTFSSIVAEVSEADDTDEAGKLTLNVAASDGTTTSLNPGLILEGEHATSNEVDVTIANGTSSTTTIAGDLSITTGLILDSVDVTAIQTGSESHSDNDTSLMTSAAILNLIQSSTFLSHYQFLGYANGNGSTYDMPKNLTDGQSPFEHDDPSSADGLTIPASGGTNQSEMIRMGGQLMSRAGTLTKWRGIATNTNNKDLTLGLFKWTPSNNSAGDMTPVLLDEVVIGGKGNDLTITFSTTSFDQTAVAEGDIIFTQIKTEAAGNIAYFNSTLEVLHS